jgi:hypothetical protein
MNDYREKGNHGLRRNYACHCEIKINNGFFSGENYMIKFDKEGYQPVTRQVGSKVEGWYWGNILFGGLIGMSYRRSGNWCDV